MELKTKVEGFAGLEDALIELEQLSGRTTTGKNAVQRGMRKALQRIEDKAKSLVPVEEGALRDSIKTRKKRARRGAGGIYLRETGITMMTGPTGRQEGGNAAWQEEGTVKMPAQPYMRPAADSEGQAVVDDVARTLRDEVMKSVGRARKKAARGK